MACVDTWEEAPATLVTPTVCSWSAGCGRQRVMLTTFTREMLVKRPDGGIGRFTYIAKNYGP